MKKLIAIASAIAALIFGGAVLAQNIGQLSSGYVEEGNLVRGGNIINTITMSNRGQNAGTCRAACDADSGCAAYSYIQYAPNRKPVCYLRMIALPSGSKRSHGYTQAVSGTKVSYVKASLDATLYENTVLRNASEIRRFVSRADDPVECADACWRDGSCNSFTYAPKGSVNAKAAMCVLNSGAGQRATEAGFLSGVKGGKASNVKSTRPKLQGKPASSVKPILRPRKPVATVQPTDPVKTVPDATLSDDDDAELGSPDQFPGEMLTPDN